MQWLAYVSKEAYKGKNVKGSGGNEPPAITYNQEVEDMVTDICRSKPFRAAYSDSVARTCTAIIGAHKRAIVAQFLSKDLGAKFLPDRKTKVCSGLVKACGPELRLSGTKKCELCVSVADDLRFVVNRGRHPNAAKWKAKFIWKMIDEFCHHSILRHREPRVEHVTRWCDDLIDEHDEAVVRALVKHRGGEAAGEQICVKVAKVCKKGQYAAARKAGGGAGKAEL